MRRIEIWPGMKVQAKMSEEEAAKVVLPVLGRVYVSKGYGFESETHGAKRDSHGRPIVASDGKGKLRAPIGGEYIDGDPVARYRQLMKAAGREADPRAVHWNAYRAAGMDRVEKGRG